ncbi:hypothetical protein M1B74_12660 [Bacteroides pyogenes]|uniref:hypothetical protein n=1 Tax=Bacteroides pyogenes TaxID=310300 RepID=UPI0005588D66|nr:hypothetical protein [Bacteroides pyogenes]MBB3894270.1 beta-lactamase regulating signal transducer with metallopeptidase domain [Bacteroides pyogenes]SUV35774.1 Uncharacterised protein [Bacteroides pyogenes]
MINWQEWVVGIIVLLCIIRVLYGVLLFLRRTEENKNPCSTCVTGCELKELMEKKRNECKSQKKSSKKKCCG